MPLRKSPARTPVMLAAHRHNAQISTDPRTWHSDAGSRLNPLQEGGQSREYVNFLTALMIAPWTQVGLKAKSLLHSLAGRYLLCLQAVILASRNGTAHRDESRHSVFSGQLNEIKFFYDERSRNIIENKGPRNLNSCRTR